VWYCHTCYLDEKTKVPDEKGFVHNPIVSKWGLGFESQVSSIKPWALVHTFPRTLFVPLGAMVGLLPTFLPGVETPVTVHRALELRGDLGL
jgi:hypothetical protein